MDIREKLEILRHKLAGMISAAVEPCDEGECCESCKYFHSTACTDYLIADFLIANGVTVQECGVWIGEGDGYADGEIVYDVWYCENCNHCIETDDYDLLPNFCQTAV